MYHRTANRRQFSPEDWLMHSTEGDFGDYCNLAFLEMDDQDVEDLGAAIQAELLRRAQ